MAGAFVLVFLLSLLALVVGLIKPGLVVRWGVQRTRKRSSLTYGALTLASLIAFAITVPDSPPPTAASVPGAKNPATTSQGTAGGATSQTADSKSPSTASAHGTSPSMAVSTDTYVTSKANTSTATTKVAADSVSSPAVVKTSTTGAPKNLIPVIVSKITDGDTIHVRLPTGQYDTIRMLLIDTPEDVDPVKPVGPYGLQAAAYAKRVLPVGKHIYIQEGEPGYTTDKYGRLLAYVFITPHDMYNEDVVRLGLARVAYIYPPNTQYLSTLEADQTYAKDHHLDIWSIPGYVTSSGYSLSVACPWAAKYGYSTRGCPTTPSSGSGSGTGGSSGGSTSSGRAISIVSSTLNVTPGDYASVTIHTTPGATGSIEVDYKSGPSHASGLGTETAGMNGDITWTWDVGTHTTAGIWPVYITVAGHTLKTYVHVQ